MLAGLCAGWKALFQVSGFRFQVYGVACRVLLPRLSRFLGKQATQGTILTGRAEHKQSNRNTQRPSSSQLRTGPLLLPLTFHWLMPAQHTRANTDGEGHHVPPLMEGQQCRWAKDVKSGG